MSEQFSILIDSRTRFETGEPGGVWLSMPTTKEQLHETMQRVGITADNPQDFFINGFANTEQQPFDVPLSVIQSAGLDELNYLGNLLSIMCASVVIIFAVLTVLESPYLGWNFSDPETAVMGTAIHAFEWLFVRLAPIIFIGAVVGIFLTRSKD